MARISPESRPFSAVAGFIAGADEVEAARQADPELVSHACRSAGIGADPVAFYLVARGEIVPVYQIPTFECSRVRRDRVRDFQRPGTGHRETVENR
jgi:hypothetical protein